MLRSLHTAAAGLSTRRLLAFAAVAISAATTAFAAERPLVPVNGEPTSAALMSVTAAGELKFAVPGDYGRDTWTLAELVSWGAPREPQGGTRILLAGDALLVARILSADTNQLKVDSLVFGEVQIPLELVQGVLFSPPGDPQLADELDHDVRNTGGQSDRLVFANGDALEDTIERIVDKQVHLKSGVGPIPFSQLKALVFDPSLGARLGRGIRALAGFSDGSRLCISSLVLPPGDPDLGQPLEITLEEGPKWAALAEDLIYLRPLGGRAVYLSDLPEDSYRHVPYLKLPWPFHRDRNAAGTRLRTDERLWTKGIGMHSTARLTFALDGKYQRFESLLGIDDHTAGRGSVGMHVFVDGKRRYSSPPIRGGAPAHPVQVDVKGAKRLSLIVDFGERGNEFDRANWLGARLIRE